MTFTKTETKWIINYINGDGNPVEWWHPLEIPNLMVLSEKITITEDMLRNIFTDPETSDRLIHSLKANVPGPYYTPQE